MRFAVDLDGTIFEQGGLDVYTPERIGVPCPGVREVLQVLIDAGHDVVIFSCRTNPEYYGNHPYTVEQLIEFVEEHLLYHEIPYTDITVYKPVVDYYLDDRNLVYSTWLDFGGYLRRLGII